MASKIRPGMAEHESVESRAWRADRRRFVPSRGNAASDDFGVTCHHTADGDVWLVSLTGEHDLTTIPLLDHHTRHIWPRCRVVVIDLSGVTFLDTGMIAWLLRVETTLEEAGCWTLSIVEGPAEGVTGRLFARLRMRHVLACYPTVRAAFMQTGAGSGTVAWPSLSSSTPA